MLPQARLHQVRENRGKKQKWKCLDIILTNKMVCLCHAIPGKSILDIYFAIICLSFTNLESHSFDLSFLKKNKTKPYGLKQIQTNRNGPLKFFSNFIIAGSTKKSETKENATTEKIRVEYDYGYHMRYAVISN